MAGGSGVLPRTAGLGVVAGALYAAPATAGCVITFTTAENIDCTGNVSPYEVSVSASAGTVTFGDLTQNAQNGSQPDTIDINIMGNNGAGSGASGVPSVPLSVTFTGGQFDLTSTGIGVFLISQGSYLSVTSSTPTRACFLNQEAWISSSDTMSIGRLRPASKRSWRTSTATRCLTWPRRPCASIPSTAAVNS